jgi:hypothetical protein
VGIELMSSRRSLLRIDSVAHWSTLAIVGVFALLSAVRLIALLQVQWAVVDEWGVDYRFFMQAASQLLSGQGLYAAEQLAGPYDVNFHSSTDVWYPPPAAVLFVGFYFLPAALWWAVPLLAVGYGIYRWKPRIWTWPLIAFALWWPGTWQAVIYGSTALWITAFIAGGCCGASQRHWCC